MTKLQDRICGTLIGLVAGDRIGGPIQMVLELSESLIQQKSFDPDDVFNRYLAWWNRAGFDTGPVADRVFAFVTKGIPRQEATQQVHVRLGGQTAGCNPAHRTPPLAMAGFIPDDLLSQAAHEEAALTHWDALAGDVAALSVMLCRKLIGGVEWAEAIETLLPAETYPVLRNDPKSLLKRGGFAPDVFYAAVYFVDTYSTFQSALSASIDFAGGANYCPVLVGAFGGARWGRESISDNMLRHCQPLLPRVSEVAERLTQTWE